MCRRPAITDPVKLHGLQREWMDFTILELAHKYQVSKATLYATARRHGFPPRMVKGRQVRKRPRLNYVSGKDNPVIVIRRCPDCAAIFPEVDGHVCRRANG